jgi:hypothetical protein
MYTDFKYFGKAREAGIIPPVKFLQKGEFHA